MDFHRHCPSEVWREFVALSPQGSVFADDRLLRSAGLEVDLVTVESGGHILLGCPLLWHEQKAVGASWPFLQYHSPLLSREVCAQPIHRATHQMMEVTNFFLENLEQCADRAFFSFHHSYPDVRAYSWFHYHDAAEQRFQFQPLYTGIIDLNLYQNLDHYLGSIRELRRRQYKKAAAKEYNIIRSNDIELLDQLHRATFDRQGIPRDPHHVRIMKDICTTALREGFGDLFLSFDPSGDCAAGAFFLRDAHTAYYLIGANEPAHRNSGASTNLLINLFFQYKEQGCRYVDLVGVNSPSRGDYKTSLNALPCLYLQARWQRDGHLT